MYQSVMVHESGLIDVWIRYTGCISCGVRLGVCSGANSAVSLGFISSARVGVISGGSVGVNSRVRMGVCRLILKISLSTLLSSVTVSVGGLYSKGTLQWGW